MKMEYHNSVLLRDSIDALAIKEDGVYVDITFGGGGHSRDCLLYTSPSPRDRG